MANTRVRYGISDAEFTNVWQTSANATEVANRLTELARSKGTITAEQSVKKSVVLARASLYRKVGVNLKMMDRRGNRPRRDVAALNAQIEQLASGQTT